MHPVDDHVVFVRVADRRGFTAAGRELRMSTAVVSSRIAKLEEQLGQKLFVRNTRQISLTEEGKIYYDYCQRLIDETAELQKRFEELKQRPAGALRISAPITMGRNVIAPIVPAFVAENADVQVRLQATDRLADILNEDIDLAIRKGTPDSSSFITKTVAPDLRVVCASPDYFERHGVPQTPEDLKNHNCLLLRFPGSRRYYWQFQHEDGEVRNLMAAGDFDSNSSDVLIDWALAGKGVIMKSVWDIYPDIEAGRLVPILLPYCVTGMTIQAIMPPRKPQPVKTTAFVEFLRLSLKTSLATQFTDPKNLEPYSFNARQEDQTPAPQRQTSP